MAEDPNDLTTHRLISAMDMLASLRCMVTATDWNSPVEVSVGQEGITACLGLAMAMLEQVADGLGCLSEADAQIKAGADRTWSVIADHQKGGRA